MRFNEWTRYDIRSDCEMTRMSGFDARGSEYWCDVPTCAGRRWRELREAARDAIEYAIESRQLPGRVAFDADAINEHRVDYGYIER